MSHGIREFAELDNVPTQITLKQKGMCMLDIVRKILRQVTCLLMKTSWPSLEIGPSQIAGP